MSYLGPGRGDKGRIRNFGAMGNDKLKRVMDELSNYAPFDAEAYAAARAVAERRGILCGILYGTVANKPVAAQPAAPWPRGFCAADGCHRGAAPNGWCSDHKPKPRAQAKPPEKIQEPERPRGRSVDLE